MKHVITAGQVHAEAVKLAASLALDRATRLWGVPPSGVPVALTLAALSGAILVPKPEDADFIVDGIWDTGRTAERYEQYPGRFAALFDKRDAAWAGKWLVLPWEVGESNHDKSAEDTVVRLLKHIGEDPNREGLQQTPRRFIKAWEEWASGYAVDPAEVLKTFEDGATDEMVVVHNIPVVSKCEHHLADIIGAAHVGYIPNGKIVGLSKLPRLVEVFTRRLQVQERLTSQIADALIEHLQPRGVGVLIRAAHHCMSTRGVRIHGSLTTTSAMRGALLDQPAARAEFLALCRDAEAGK